MADEPPKRFVRRSRGEMRVTYALKIVALVVLCAVVGSAILSFLGRVPSFTVIAIGAIFFTYIIYPFVRFFHARGAPLMLAVAMTYLLFVGVIVIGTTFVIPPLASDTSSLVASTPHFVHVVQNFVENPNNPIATHLPPPARTYLAKMPAQAVEYAQRYAGVAAGSVLGFIASLVGLIATLVVIPVLAIYLIFETPDMLAAIMRALPPRARPKATTVLRDLDKAIGGFIRGQVAVGAVIGTCIVIALLILRVKYALLIGVVAGIFDIIPFVGAFVGFVPAVLLALVNQGWQHALIVALVFVGIFQAEGHFISPKIVSDSVGLSPLTVIVAILIGGELGGIGGMFMAVPIAAIIRVVILNFVPRVKAPVDTPAAPTVGEIARAANAPVEAKQAGNAPA